MPTRRAARNSEVQRKPALLERLFQGGIDDLGKYVGYRTGPLRGLTQLDDRETQRAGVQRLSAETLEE